MEDDFDQIELQLRSYQTLAYMLKLYVALLHFPPHCVCCPSLPEILGLVHMSDPDCVLFFDRSQPFECVALSVVCRAHLVLWSQYSSSGQHSLFSCPFSVSLHEMDLG